MKKLVLTSVLISVLTTASAMAETGFHSSTSVGAPQDTVITKTTAGDQKTATYADKPITVQHGTKVDPYTGTSDRNNFAGKAAIAPNQVPMDKAKH